MRRVLAGFATAVGLFLAAAPLSAHHAASAQFDMAKPVKVTGVLVKVEWQNPHIWYYLDVKDESGKVTTWGFEGGPPGMLLRRGIKKESLKLGEVITVQGFRAKDGSNNGNGTTVTFADGRQVFPAFGEELVGGARPR